MRLPQADRCQVPVAKIVQYLLSPEHRFGRFKAAFFFAHGFSRDTPDQLSSALRNHAIENTVTASQETEFGVRYRIDGPLAAPDGSRVLVRSIWFSERGAGPPRFVTAYPLKTRPGR